VLVLPELAVPVVGKVTCFSEAAVEYSWSHFQDRPQGPVAVAFPGSVRIGVHRLLVCWPQKGSSAPPHHAKVHLLLAESKQVRQMQTGRLFYLVLGAFCRAVSSGLFQELPCRYPTGGGCSCRPSSSGCEVTPWSEHHHRCFWSC